MLHRAFGFKYIIFFPFIIHVLLFMFSKIVNEVLYLFSNRYFYSFTVYSLSNGNLISQIF